MFIKIKKTFSIFLLVVASLMATVYPVYASQSSDFRFPSFMMVEVIDDSLNINGYTVQSYSFETSKKESDILNFYTKLWDGSLKTVATKQWNYHSYYDGEYLYTIQVRNLDKSSLVRKTHGLIGISKPSLFKKKPKKIKIEKLYPINPGALNISDISGVDFGKKSRTTVIDSPGSALSNLNHYKLHFVRKGWVEVKKDLAGKMIKKAGRGSLIMQKGKDELVVSFIPDGTGRTKVVGVYVDK